MNITDEVSKKFYLSESGHGAREVQFAIIDKENHHTITPFCMCKDYFTDLFWSRATGKDVSVYGFKWSPKDHDEVFNRSTISVAIRIRDRNDKSNLYRIEDKEIKSLGGLLNKFNSANKFEDFEIELSDDERYIIVTVDKAWTTKPYLISALFLIFRLGLTYDGTSEVIEYFGKSGTKFISPNDVGYFASCKMRLKDLLEGKICTAQTFDEYSSEHSAHGSSGIVCYSKYKI